MTYHDEVEQDELDGYAEAQDIYRDKLKEQYEDEALDDKNNAASIADKLRGIRDRVACGRSTVADARVVDEAIRFLSPLYDIGSDNDKLYADVRATKLELERLNPKNKEISQVMDDALSALKGDKTCPEGLIDSLEGLKGSFMFEDDNDGENTLRTLIERLKEPQYA